VGGGGHYIERTRETRELTGRGYFNPSWSLNIRPYRTVHTGSLSDRIYCSKFSTRHFSSFPAASVRHCTFINPIFHHFLTSWELGGPSVAIYVSNLYKLFSCIWECNGRHYCADKFNNKGGLIRWTGQGAYRQRLKGPSGQIRSAREWNLWIGLG
jgi:hypothetical protein